MNTPKDVKKSSRKRFNWVTLMLVGFCFILIVATTQFATQPPRDCEKLFNGRMTGGGLLIAADGTRITHGFELHCNPTIDPHNFELNFNGNQFHLEQVIDSYCFEDPNLQQENPSAPINTLVLAGFGRYNGVSGARIAISLTDDGEPGVTDELTVVILDVNGNVVLQASGYLSGGNHQAHRENKD